MKSFLKAGVFTETRQHEDSFTGTPQGGILSPLLANVALSVLDAGAPRVKPNPRSNAAHRS